MVLRPGWTRLQLRRGWLPRPQGSCHSHGVARDQGCCSKAAQVFITWPLPLRRRWLLRRKAGAIHLASSADLCHVVARDGAGPKAP